MKAKGNTKKKSNQQFKDFLNYFQVEGTFYVAHSPRHFLCNSLVDYFSLLSTHLIVVITPFQENFQLNSVYLKLDINPLLLRLFGRAQLCGLITLRRNLDGVSQHCLINNCNLVEQFHRKLKLII